MQVVYTELGDRLWESRRRCRLVSASSPWFPNRVQQTVKGLLGLNPNRELPYVSFLSFYLRMYLFLLSRCYGGEHFINSVLDSSPSLSPKLTPLRKWLGLPHLGCVLSLLPLSALIQIPIIPLGIPLYFHYLLIQIPIIPFYFHSYLTFILYVSENILKYKQRNSAQTILTKQTECTETNNCNKKRVGFRHRNSNDSIRILFLLPYLSTVLEILLIILIMLFYNCDYVSVSYLDFGQE